MSRFSPRKVTTLLVAAAGLSVAALSACQSSSPPAPRPASPSASSSPTETFSPAALGDVTDPANELVAGSTSLGANLLAHETAPNSVVSPWAVTRALGHVRLGAQGRTAEEMDSVLGFPSAERDEAFSAIINTVESDGLRTGYSAENPPESPVFHSADGLFLADSLPVVPDFVSTAKKVFGSDVEIVSFPDEAQSAMAAFTEEHTGGLISAVPPPAAGTTLTILSTTLFASPWRQGFGSVQTRGFTLADGTSVSAEMMFDERRLSIASGDTWQAVDLPYSGNQVMRLVLPSPDVPVADVLTAEVLEEVDRTLEAAQAPASEVVLILPTWEVTHTSTLTDSLRELGLERVFSDQAELAGIAPRVRVAEVQQQTTITVGQRGTVAASRVEVDAGEFAAPDETPEPTPTYLVFDRPFVYSIVDRPTGATLFMGRVDDPSL